MSLFAVDPELCVQDGICVAECPRFLIEMQDEDSCPTPVEGADDHCIDCGHCVAVCPTGALSLKTLAPEECGDVRAELLPSAAQVEHFLRTRRSIRTFQQNPVPRDVLARLIDIARYAPSASNGQPVEWLVIYDAAQVQRLASLSLDWLRQDADSPSRRRSVAIATAKGLDLVCRSAPHAILAHTPEGKETDGVIALTHLELAAYSLGLGACWSGYASSAINGSQELREFVNLPDGHVSCGVMLLGYPEYTFQRIPSRNPARVVWRLVR